MQEFSVPASYVVKPDDNITDDLFRNEEKWPDEVGAMEQTHVGWAVDELGPAIGGVRMRPDVTPGEVAWPARAMSVKNTLAGGGLVR